MNRHFAKIVAAFLGTVSFGAARAEVDVNSLERRVEGFIYPSTAGTFSEYRVTGFAQPINAGGAGVRPRMFLMPLLKVPEDGVRFADESGIDYTPGNCATRPARVITFTIASYAALPNDMQRVAVGAALDGKNPEFYLSHWPVNSVTGEPLMWAAAMGAPDVRTAVNEVYRNYKKLEDAQNAALAVYDRYDVSFATLDEFNLDLKVAGEIVATTGYKGSLIGGAPVKLAFVRPDTFSCNQIARGNYEIIARYRFRDTKSSTINAIFDARASVNNFVEETQTAITKQRNSGWKILGIGSRHSKMKSSLDATLTSKTEIGTIQNTTIVMVDADDSMVKKFESAFFPQLTKDEAISAHLTAATQADQAGNADLAKVHRDYAAALTNGSEDLENDAVGAAAALSKKDYAAFIAKGVRFSESNTSRTDSFRRTIEASVSTSETQTWDQVMTVTRLRESSMPVGIAALALQKPTLGSISGGTYTVPWYDGYSYPSPRAGFLVGWVDPNGPLAGAGIEPGMLLFKIAGQQVKTRDDFNAVVASLTPRDQVDIVRYENSGGVFATPYGPQVQTGRTITTTVTVASKPAPRSQ